MVHHAPAPVLQSFGGGEYDRCFHAVTVHAADADEVLEHVEVTIVGIFLVAEIFEKIIFYVALANLRPLVGKPVQKLADEMIMLGAVKRHLRFRKLPLRPQLEEGVVFAVLFIARGDQLIMKIAAHKGSSLVHSTEGSFSSQKPFLSNASASEGQ